jgi:DNA-binding FrmR family transcriptional regulator
MGLLQSANRELLKNHLSCCGTKALSSEWKEKEDFIEELVRTWDVATRK